MPAFFGGRGGRGPGFKPKAPADPLAKIAELAKLTCESPPFGTPAPDAELLRALKREVRRDDAAMDRVHDVLLRALAHEECGPRMHAVAVIDQLFHRSHRFRGLITDALDAFLKRAIGVDPDAHPLPGPPDETRKLIDRAVAALASWNETFGTHLPRLTFALRFANDALGPDAPAARAEAAARAERLRARRENAALIAQWRRVEAGLPSVTRDTREAVAAMRAGVREVLGGDAEDADADDDEWEDVARGGGGDGGGYNGGENGVSQPPPRTADRVTPADSSARPESTIAVRETPENALALAHLRDACRVARGRSVPALAAALALLAKLAPEEEPPAGDAGVSAAARAATLNALAALKRDAIEWLARCRSIGIEEAVLTDEEDEMDERERRTETTNRDEERSPGSTLVGTTNRAAVDAGALVVAVPVSRGVASSSGNFSDLAGGEDGAPFGGGGTALDDLLERARRRQRGRARATSARDPRAPFWMGRRAATPGSDAGGPGGSGTSSSSAAAGSAAARARRIFASREASAHNASVMRELGESGVERRDGVSGFADAVARRAERNASEDAARALAEREARDAKRRRNEPTAKQRIEAKLKRMKRGGSGKR
jgi:hypothetical protein